MKSLLQDIRYSVRMMSKKPTFTIVAIITLALGIGANTAIFSVINSVLLRPLPYKDPEQLMTLWEAFNIEKTAKNPVAPANFTDWREQNQSFSGMEAYTDFNYFNLSGNGEPEKIQGISTTDGFFNLLGVQPILGRTYTSGEGNENFNGVVISYGLWQRRFGGDKSIINKQITLDGETAVVMGVMPSSFRYPSRTINLWTTLDADKKMMARRDAHFLKVIGRLKQGVSFEQARADIETIGKRLTEQYPKTNKYVATTIIPMQEDQVQDLRLALLVLQIATLFVMLIVCANVANLLLSRVASRQKEMAVRSALGAGRMRLVRQLLTESMILSISGGAIGIVLALWGVPALVSLMPEDMEQAKVISVDFNMLFFAIAVSALSGIVFGLVPAIKGARPDINSTLKDGVQNAKGLRSGLRGILVVSEIAVSLILLIGAGLLINSFWRLNNIDMGFRTDNLLTMEIQPTFEKYPDQQHLKQHYDEVLRRVEAIPGVESAALVTELPPKQGRGRMTFITEQKEGTKVVGTAMRNVSPDYFNTMGIPLLKGRTFTAQDTEKTDNVAVINEAMAREAWRDENPIGKRIKMGIETNPWITIVGVVKDTLATPRSTKSSPQVFITYTQSNAFAPGELVVRTKANPLSFADPIRKEIWAVDKDQPVANISTMEELLGDSIARQRFNMLLLSIFAALALVLAAVGIYGVMSYAVTQSTREIGIRMTLGAETKDVLVMVLLQGLLLAFVGVGIGLAGAFGLMRLMKSLLFGVGVTDPVTYMSVSAILILIALIACYIPARRATKVDPMVALRYE